MPILPRCDLYMDTALPYIKVGEHRVARKISAGDFMYMKLKGRDVENDIKEDLYIELNPVLMNFIRNNPGGTATFDFEKRNNQYDLDLQFPNSTSVINNYYDEYSASPSEVYIFVLNITLWKLQPTITYPHYSY